MKRREFIAALGGAAACGLASPQRMLLTDGLAEGEELGSNVL
jgi:hypothetical protein